MAMSDSHTITFTTVGLVLASGSRGSEKRMKAVRAHLQQNARQDHRARRGRLNVGVRQPGVEREHRHLDGEPDGERDEDPNLHLQRPGMRVLHQLDEVKGMPAVGQRVIQVERQDSQQHQDGAGQAYKGRT